MTNNFHTLDDCEIEGKRVLVRADLNVPLEQGIVRDTTRIERIAPTLKELVSRGAIVIVLSHLGRPRGTVVPNMSLAPLAGPLSVALDRPVRFVATNWTNGKAKRAVDNARPGDILLLENTRFHPGEEKNQPRFVKMLTDLGDIFINDAFSAAHRAHASTEGVAWFLPNAAGRAMETEISALEENLIEPKRPLTAIIGGAKISTKIDVVGHLCSKVDCLVIGGGMANTFLEAQGHNIGKSIGEHEMVETVHNILKEAENNSCEIVLPVDVVVAEDFKPHAPYRVVDLDSIGNREMILDCGPETVKQIEAVIDRSRTLVWNGPMGAFELPPFDAGTIAVAEAAAARCRQNKLVAIGGGGDTIAALNHKGLADDFTYVSTAGGAFLEWLEGKVLPGVEVLQISAA